MAKVDEILATIRTLEPLPEVALRVMTLSRRPDVIPREIAECVQTDPATTAKVLRLCNSAYYGFQRVIASLPEAANLLGTRTLTSLVLTSCGACYFRDVGRSSSSARQALWKRSVANALAAGMLARLHGDVDRNRAYTAGLLQDIGRLALDRYLDEERDAIVAEVRSGTPLLEAEQQVLGIDHAEVGARLVERWSFPDVLVDTIRHHHAPEHATVDAELASLVQLGEHVAGALEGGEGLAGLLGELADYSLDLEGLGGLSIGELESMLASELERAREFVVLA
jgi:putative nucleotidyltransferase with HDIG domain